MIPGSGRSPEEGDGHPLQNSCLENPMDRRAWRATVQGWQRACCCCEVTQSCPTLCNPTDCSLPGSSVHGIFQTRILERVAISFSRGSSRPRDRTWVSCFVGRRFYCLSHQGSQTTRHNLVTEHKMMPNQPPMVISYPCLCMYFRCHYELMDIFSKYISFLFILNNVPFYGYTTFCLFTYVL